MLRLSEPKIIERGLYRVVGCYGEYEGDACFAYSLEHSQRPPHVETVYIKIEIGD